MEGLLVIAGAPKAGTTSLAHWLDARDDMRLAPGKEPRHFTDFAERSWQGPRAEAFHSTIVTDRATYLRGFADARWGIDASTDYLACEDVPGRIAAFARERGIAVKVLILLRDPLERAFSQYMHTVRGGLEHLPFPEAVRREAERVDQGWQPLFAHAGRSRYLPGVMRFREVFGTDLLLMDFGELGEPERALARVAGFLGLPAQPCADLTPLNQSYRYRSAALARLRTSPILRRGARAVLPRSIRQGVRRTFEHHARERPQMSARDRSAIWPLLREDAAQCLDHPALPTDSWRTTRMMRAGDPVASTPFN